MLRSLVALSVLAHVATGLAPPRPLSRRLVKPLRASAVAPVAPVASPTDSEHVTKWMQKPGRSGSELPDGSVLVVRYTGRVAGADTSTAPFAASDKFQVTVGKGDMVKGWDAALRSMQLGERAIFRCAPESGYGAEGIAPVIPPNAMLEFDIEVLDYRGNIFTSSTFAENAPLIPRTAREIKAEYEKRQAVNPAGDDGFIETVIKRLTAQVRGENYIFGFFEAGPNKERPPWYLRPSLTFPLMLGGVLFTAWFLAFSGGVMLKGSGGVIPGEGTDFQLL